MLNQPTPSRTAPALRLRGVVLGKCINPNAFGNALGSSLATANSGVERPSNIKALTANDLGNWNGPTAQDALNELATIRFSESSGGEASEYTTKMHFGGMRMFEKEPEQATNIQARKGDSWAKLARVNYGDERYALALAKANDANGTLLRTGQDVILPDLSGANLKQGGAFIAADTEHREAEQRLNSNFGLPRVQNISNCKHTIEEMNALVKQHSGYATQLNNASDWAYSQENAEAGAAYRQAAIKASYVGMTYSTVDFNLSADSQRAVPTSVSVNPFYLGWGTGDAQAGIPSGNGKLPDGNYGVGFYAGLGGEIELGLENNRITDIKIGLGGGVGGHLNLATKTLSGEILRGPGGGWKSDIDFLTFGQKQLLGDFRIGSSLTVAAGVGSLGAEYSGSGGIYSNSDGHKGGFWELKPSVTVSPVVPKIQGEIKFKLFEFAYKRAGGQ